MSSGFWFVFITFLVWRVVLVLVIIVGSTLSFNVPSIDVYTLYHWLEKPGNTMSIALYTWGNFDGVHYASIAFRGYIDEGRFLPVYSGLISILSRWLGTTSFASTYWLGLLISNVSLLASIYVLYRLIKKDYGVEIAKWTVICLLVFPSAFFLGSVYTESLFLLLSLVIFWLIRMRFFFWSVIISILLPLVRIVGLAIIPVLVLVYILNIKKTYKNKYIVFRNILLLILILNFGLILYGFYNYSKWGDFWYFLHAHGQLGNSRMTDSLVIFPQTVYRYIKIMFDFSFNYQWWVAMSELATFLLVGSIFAWGWKKLDWKYLLYGLLLFLIPVSSGTFSGITRYVIVIFPFFVLLSMLLKTFYLRALYLFVAILLQIAAVFYFSKGYYVA